MKAKIFLTISLGGLLLLQGCAVPHSYPNPKFAASPAGILKPAKPRPVMLSVVAQRKGVPIGLTTRIWHNEFEHALDASGVFIVTKSAPADDLQITINNTGDLASTIGRSITSGITFGLVGSTANDHFIVTASYRRSDGLTLFKKYQHSVQTVIGKVDPRPAGTSMSPPKAVSTVANDITLRLIKDIQSSTGNR